MIPIIIIMIKIIATTIGEFMEIYLNEFRIQTISQAIFATLVNWIIITIGRNEKIVYRVVLTKFGAYFEFIEISTLELGLIFLKIWDLLF